MKTKYRDVKAGFTLKNNALDRKISSREPKATHNSIPLTWARAKDFSVWDDRGNKFLDLTSGIFVANAGHANPYIIKAIKKQLDSNLVFSYNYPTKIKDQLISKLLALSPKHFNAVTLLNSGSEAMDIVYKMLKLYAKKTGKKYIITFKGSYHGRGLSNDFIAGKKEKAAWSGLEDKNVIFLDFPYEGTERFDMSKLPKGSEIAGFVLETFQGWGAWFYPKEFVVALDRFAKKHGALVAFDEMQAGFYRIGPIYGYLTYGAIKPDLIALGKGITSSLPLSAVLSSKKLFDIGDTADLHGTHSANAVCAAAALANIEFLSSKKEIARRKKTIPVFEKEMASLSEFTTLVKTINVRGLIAGIIFHKTEDATAVVHECIKRGVLPVCTNRESIKIAPPLTMPIDAIREAIGVMRDVLKERSK